MEKLEAFKLFATKCSYFQILATEASVEMSCIMKKDVIMRNLLYLLKWLGNVERVMSSKLITEFTLFRNSLQTRFSGYIFSILDILLKTVLSVKTQLTYQLPEGRFGTTICSKVSRLLYFVRPKRPTGNC